MTPGMPGRRTSSSSSWQSPTRPSPTPCSQALGEAGVDTLELSTDDDLAAAIVRFAELRRRRSRLSGAGGGLPTHLRAAMAA